MELLIGSGQRSEKLVYLPERRQWRECVTLDYNVDHRPDIVADFNYPLPFKDETFEEIHAYEVLEHTGRQGDWKFFFNQFADIWRLLKPGGTFHATVPAWDSVWAWADPSHTRVVPLDSLVFLSQRQYREQVGRTPMSDFRFYWKRDFDILHTDTVKGTAMFVLVKR